jgi:hypothetical protein
MKVFHAKKWLNKEFKKYDMWIEERGSGWCLQQKTDVSALRVAEFCFDPEWGEWCANPQTSSTRFCYDQLRLICSTVDELNRQYEMERDV